MRKQYNDNSNNNLNTNSNNITNNRSNNEVDKDFIKLQQGLLPSKINNNNNINNNSNINTNNRGNVNNINVNRIMPLGPILVNPLMPPPGFFMPPTSNKSIPQQQQQKNKNTFPIEVPYSTGSINNKNFDDRFKDMSLNMSNFLLLIPLHF